MLLNTSSLRSLAVYAVVFSSVALVLVLVSRREKPFLPELVEHEPWRHDADHFEHATHPKQFPHHPHHDFTNEAPDHSSWSFDYSRDANKYGLSEEQCLLAFPKLYHEVDRAVAFRRKSGAGKIQLEDLDVGWRGDGIMRLMIYDNQLYVINAKGVTDHNHRPRAVATLNSINRAVSSFPGGLPNIEFTFVTHDAAYWIKDQNVTTLAYTRKAEHEALWLMPDFGLWGWPNVGLNSYVEYRKTLERSEDDFLDKIPKLIWRGAVGTVGSRISREGLLKHSEGHSWADVKRLDWGDKEQIAHNLIAMDDLCGNMFVAQTEGNSYSGRLKYLLNCHSIVMSHELTWIEHYHHLLEPRGPEQNIVLLEKDFKDLPATMESFLASPAHLEHAQAIADNSVSIFRERYLTPAAEACYWRALFRGWASVQGFEAELYETKEVEDKVKGGMKSKTVPRGAPFEAYAIMEEVHWQVPARPRKIVVDG